MSPQREFTPTSPDDVVEALGEIQRWLEEAKFSGTTLVVQEKRRLPQNIQCPVQNSPFFADDRL